MGLQAGKLSRGGLIFYEYFSVFCQLSDIFDGIIAGQLGGNYRSKAHEEVKDEKEIIDGDGLYIIAGFFNIRFEWCRVC